MTNPSPNETLAKIKAAHKLPIIDEAMARLMVKAPPPPPA